MFTGIIESKGEIISIANKTNSREFTVSLDNMFDDVNIGDSIAVNGVCLTATGISSNQINFDVISETLEKSNLGDLEIDSQVNLERALTLSSRLGGHILQGHVETIGIIMDIEESGKGAILSIAIDPLYMRYCIPKGSIALDGVSLTIASILDNIVKIALIPHTLEMTTLGSREIGDSLNIETDIIGKYIERLMSFEDGEDQIDNLFLKDLKNWEFGES